MDSCLFAVLIIFLSRVDLRNGNGCLSLKMVSLIGLRLFIFFCKDFALWREDTQSDFSVF